MKRREMGFSALIVILLAASIAVAIMACGGGTEASGVKLYSNHTTSQEVVEDWAGLMVNSATSSQTGIDVTYDDTDGALDFLSHMAGGTQAIASGSTSAKLIAHVLGATPTWAIGVDDQLLAYRGGTFTATTMALSRSGTGSAARTIHWVCGR